MAMARKKPKGKSAASMVFNVTYEDGAVTSNRRISNHLLDQSFGEVHRCLKDRRYLAVFVSDTFKKKRGFVGIGAELYALLRERFRAVDHVVVVRGNRKLEKPRHHKVAVEQNFFLRGFNHLLIFKKESGGHGGG